MPTARAQMPVLESGRECVLWLPPPGLGTIVTAAEQLPHEDLTLESASGHLYLPLPNASKESNQATEFKLPNFQNAVAPRVTGHLPIRPALGVSPPRMQRPSAWYPWWGTGLREDSGVHAGAPGPSVTVRPANVAFPCHLQLPLRAFS